MKVHTTPPEAMQVCAMPTCATREWSAEEKGGAPDAVRAMRRFSRRA